MPILWVQGMRDKVPAVPAGIAVAGQQMRALALPAAVVHIASHLWRLRLIRQNRRRKPAKVAAASQGKLALDPKLPRSLPFKQLPICCKCCHEFFLRHACDKLVLQSGTAESYFVSSKDPVRQAVGYRLRSIACSPTVSSVA